MAEYRVEFTADSSAAERSIKNLKKEIKGVTKEFEGAEIGAAEFLEAASDLSGLQKELKDARSAVVNIDKAYQDLNKALDSIGSAYDKAGRDAQNYHNKLLGLAQDSFQQEDKLRNKNFQAEVDDFDRRLRLAAASASKMSAQQRGIMEFRAGMGARGAIPEVASPVRGGAAFPGSPAYLEEIAKAAKKAQQELDDAAKTAGTIAPQAKAFDPASLASYEAKLKLLKKEARLISPDSTRWKKLTKEILQAERGIERINKRQRLGPTGGQRLGAAGGAFLYGGGLGGGAGSALGGIAGGLAGGVPGAFAGAALGQLADNIGQALGATASYTAEIDKQRIALKNVTKDVAEYQNALTFIDKTSRDLAIPQDVLNKQFTQISASVIGAGGDIGLAKEAFMGIAAGIRGTGGSLAALEGALLATSQVFSKGKVSAEELRQQIGERLPGAFTLFAKSMGKTPQELDKMLEQGQVTLNDFMGFVRTLSSEYGASASEIAASSQAAGDRLATTMSRMREAVGRELQPLGAQFQEILANAVADNEENLVALAKAFSEAAQAIGRFIEQYGGLIASLGSTILLIGGTALAVKGIATAYAAIGPAIAAATAAIASYGGALSVAKLAMAGLGGPITLTIAGLVLLGKGVYDTNETFRNFVDNIGGVIASDFKNSVEGMAEDAQSSANNIQTAYEDLTTKLDPIGQFIKELFRDVFKDTSDSAEASATASSGSFNDFFNGLSTSATEGFNGLNTIISNWWSSLPAPIRNIFGGNAASMLAGAAGYAAALPGRTQSGAPERQGPYLPPNLPNRNEPLSGLPRQFPGTSGGDGSGGGSRKAKKEKELQEYIRNEQDFLRQVAQIGQNRIALTMGLSNEELSILQSQSQFRANSAINERQYLDDQRDAAKYSIETRDQYLNDIKEKYDNEKTLIQQQFDQSVYAPFLALERQLIGENEALAASLNALREGRLDLTAEERIGLEVGKQLQAQEAAGIQITPKLLQSIKDKAKAQDDYNKSLSYGRTMLALQNQLALAQILDPGAERRAQIKQEKPELTDVEIENQAALEEQLAAATKARDQLRSIASSIGDAFGNAFKGIITGSMTVQQALAGMFQSIADSFADMAAQMIAEYVRMQALGLLKTIFSAVAPAIGGGLSSGFGAGTSSAIDTGAGGWADSFGTSLKFANGGIAPGSFQAFANGGMVTGPTLGLVGEGRYNEAIIPLPDGKSVPVQLSGGAGGNAAPINTNIVVNVKNGQAESQMSGNQGNQLARELEGAVRQVILKESRPGGLISSSR
jgi:tape measure domain-containing protein